MKLTELSSTRGVLIENLVYGRVFLYRTMSGDDRLAVRLQAQNEGPNRYIRIRDLDDTSDASSSIGRLSPAERVLPVEIVGVEYRVIE